MTASEGPNVRKLHERQQKRQKDRQTAGNAQYGKDSDGMYRLKDDDRQQLANFAARITGEIERHDGVESTREFEIEITQQEKTIALRLPASEFQSMNWPLARVGAAAIVTAGHATKDHLRAAIQSLSNEVARSVVFVHTGWAEVDGQWVFLTAGGPIGPIGPIGPVHRVDTDLGELRGISLPASPVGEGLLKAVDASLSILDVAPPEITYPLLAAVYRAPLGGTDFTFHLAGQTGVGKTELAALAQQHYGAGLDARHLPGSYVSTANSLEALAFLAKDVVLVVDDFAPSGSVQDVQRQNREAGRLIRSQGNRTGRGRLRADATLRTPHPPRGLILSTGEETPTQQSVRARMLVLEMVKGSIKWEHLGALQVKAAEGLFAQSMSAFISWLAQRYDAVQQDLPKRIGNLRDRAVNSGHRRTAVIVASLQVGLEYFLEFAVFFGAMSATAADAHREACWRALLVGAQEQLRAQAEAEPVARFVELLIAALNSGRYRLERLVSDEHPPNWRDVQVFTSEVVKYPLTWFSDISRADPIGWSEPETDDLFLDLDSAYRAAMSMSVGADVLSLTARALGRRLGDAKLLKSHDAGHHTIRRMLGGARLRVLHLRLSLLSGTGPIGPIGPQNVESPHECVPE